MLRRGRLRISANAARIGDPPALIGLRSAIASSKDSAWKNGESRRESLAPLTMNLLRLHGKPDLAGTLRVEVVAVTEGYALKRRATELMRYYQVILAEEGIFP